MTKLLFRSENRGFIYSDHAPMLLNDSLQKIFGERYHAERRQNSAAVPRSGAIAWNVLSCVKPDNMSNDW